MKPTLLSDSESAPRVPIFDAAEWTACLGMAMRDPFRTVAVEGTLRTASGKEIKVGGFCDSQDGSVYRIRFMPTELGSHSWTATVSGPDGLLAEGAGRFDAVPGPLPGLLKAEGRHFVWSGTGQPFFWNGTTTYLLAGLEEEAALSAIRRLAGLGVNKLRVCLCASRQIDGGRWLEPQVKPRADFTYHFAPWIARQPDSQSDPQFDTGRFDIAYWRKFERLVAAARDLGVVVQVVFFIDAQEHPNYPFERSCLTGSPDERMYYAYGAARLASLSNVEWCITNEWAVFRPDSWPDVMGPILADADPYGHILSVHGHGYFPYLASSWCTHALYQVWDEDGGYDWVLAKAKDQDEAGVVMPIINEEYGYEDHYPIPWGGGRLAPARIADNRRRLAWQIVMAGGFQTTGESAASGAGGWITGVGTSSSMLEGNNHIKQLFEGLGDWPSILPRPDLSTPACLVRSGGGSTVLYLPEGGPLPGPFAGREAAGFNPRTGEHGGQPDGGGDWVWVLKGDA